MINQNIELYAFINIQNPMVAWETAIGRVISADDFYSQVQLGTSLWQYRLLKSYAQNGLTNNIKNEFMLEHVRQRAFSQSVSRLKGMYFFESEADALEALARWNWSDKKDYISKVLFSANNLTKVDSEYITHNLASLSGNNEWMYNYWQGLPHGNNPLYEILANGIGVIQNYELRKKAYELSVKNNPSAQPLLEIACCGFSAKIETLGLVRPFLVKEGNQIKGDYYIYLKDLEENISRVAAAIKENGTVSLPKPDEGLRVPDFTNMSFVLDAQNFANISL